LRDGCGRGRLGCGSEALADDAAADTEAGSEDASDGLGSHFVIMVAAGRFQRAMWNCASRAVAARSLWQ